MTTNKIATPPSKTVLQPQRIPVATDRAKLTAPLTAPTASNSNLQAALDFSGSVETLLGRILNSGGSLSLQLVALQIMGTTDQITDLTKQMDSIKKQRAMNQELQEEKRALSAFIRKQTGKEDGSMNQWDLAAKMPEFAKNHPEIMKRYPNLARAVASKGTDPEWQHRVSEALSDTLLAKFQVQDNGTGGLSAEKTGTFGATPDQKFHHQIKISAEEIDQAGEQHKLQVQKLDQLNQLVTMQLQAKIQEKQRYVTMHTNMSKSEHDMLMASARNMKA